MHGVEVKKTYPDDFEKILPLLQTFDSPFLHDDWKRIFYYQWDGAEDHVGYHLEHQAQVVGFMGLIFSCRYIQGIKYQFCNITSLIVKENYRGATLLLLRKLKLYKNTIFTGLGPIEESYRLLKALGFVDYENSYKIIPTINHYFHAKKKVKVYHYPALLDRVDQELKRIVRDHSGLACKSILFEWNGKQCLLIYTLISQRYYKIPINKIHVHYASDVALFDEILSDLLKVMKHTAGFLSAVYLDSRLLMHRDYFVFTRALPCSKIHSGLGNDQLVVDAIYSEAVLL